VAGVGGVILNPGGNKEATFAWSLVHATNNQEEAYALLKGMKLTKNRNIHTLTVIGDSKLILSYLKSKKMQTIYLSTPYSPESSRKYMNSE
jgi:ribonuclease HI